MSLTAIMTTFLERAASIYSNSFTKPGTRIANTYVLQIMYYIEMCSSQCFSRYEGMVERHASSASKSDGTSSRMQKSHVTSFNVG
jgi:hypothetical protein